MDRNHNAFPMPLLGENMMTAVDTSEPLSVGLQDADELLSLQTFKGRTAVPQPACNGRIQPVTVWTTAGESQKFSAESRRKTSANQCPKKASSKTPAQAFTWLFVKVPRAGEIMEGKSGLRRFCRESGRLRRSNTRRRGGGSHRQSPACRGCCRARGAGGKSQPGAEFFKVFGHM